MRHYNYRNIILLISINSLCCRQAYTPPNIKANINYLVVDGTIVAGQDSTIINLSRTQNINDSSYYTLNPETGATVSVVGESGDTYGLTEQSAGKYVTSQLNLNTSEKYRLKIIRTNGNQYLSDTLSVKTTPPIDSVSWQLQNDGVHIFVNTHDPQNNTRYYRWQYTETWEYRSFYLSDYVFQGDTIAVRDSAQSIYTCWHTDQSTNLLLGSSAKLASDIIYQMPLTQIPSASQQIGIEYSILVKQYALDAESYAFWQLLQQNTEQLGSLFDAQPSQLTGNIHNTANPNEPVLGYLSISTLQQQRIFISVHDVPTWGYFQPKSPCTDIVSERFVPGLVDSISLYLGPGSGFLPTIADYTPSGVLVGYYSYISTCVDCRLQGGSTVKPSFWP